MSAQNKEICRRWVEEAINQRQLDRIEEFIATDYQYHGPAEQEVRGSAGEKDSVQMYLDGFPDIKFSVEDIHAEGDKVITRWRARGTHNGVFAGYDPTGNAVDVTGIIISRIADGRIAEEWESFDELTLMKQIGAVPRDLPPIIET